MWFQQSNRLGGGTAKWVYCAKGGLGVCHHPHKCGIYKSTCGFGLAPLHVMVCKLGLYVLFLGGFHDAGRMSLRGTLGTSVLGSQSMIVGLAASQ